MKNLRWSSDYPEHYKNPNSYLFKTLIRPKGFKRAEDPGVDWIPPSDLCFLWAGTLGKLFQYSSLADEKKTVMRKYAIWIVEQQVTDQRLFELFELAHDNIWHCVENNGVPTVPCWKILRILEHVDNPDSIGFISFDRN